MYLKSINPATGETIREFPESQWEDVSNIIRDVYQAQNEWQKTSIEERLACLKSLKDLLEVHKEGYAFTISHEMGKPIAQSRAEIEKCIDLCEYYYSNTPNLLANKYIETEASSSYISHQPMGVILGIMPWNFPFWQVFRFAIPAIMCGNTIVLKHASNVPGCSVAIEDLFLESHFPTDIYRMVLVSKRKVERIIANKKIAAVSLTGSSAAGKMVAQTAGTYLKKCVLELGGSDPYLILNDANIVHAAEACVNSRMINSGQSCIGAKRIIVDTSIYNEFRDCLISKMKDIKYGDPFDEDNQIGPMARSNIRQDVLRQVNKSVKLGAHILLGGNVDTETEGFFFKPTVLENVSENMPAYNEEIFGPVISLIKANNTNHAIEIANNTCFGLGAAIFSEDIPKATKIAESKINAGSCYVNEYVKSDPRLPFGGIKGSGYGRELAHMGIYEFTNQKTVYVR